MAKIVDAYCPEAKINTTINQEPWTHSENWELENVSPIGEVTEPVVMGICTIGADCRLWARCSHKVMFTVPSNNHIIKWIVIDTRS